MNIKHDTKSTVQAQDSDKEQEFFDNFVSQQEYDVLTEYGYLSLIKSFTVLAKEYLETSQKSIDLGCGTGSFTRRFAKHLKGSMIGVDISEASVKMAKQKNDGIEYRQGDITQLDFPENTFDVVVFSGVLHHFGDFSSCLKEGYRILKKGGCLLSYDPHKYNPAMWLYRDESSPLCSKIGKTDNEQLLSKKQMQRELMQVGFDDVKIQNISGVTFKYLESPRAKILMPIYNSFEYLLGLTPLARSIGSFIICCAKK